MRRCFLGKILKNITTAKCDPEWLLKEIYKVNFIRLKSGLKWGQIYFP
jgi:hypothetical protein